MNPSPCAPCCSVPLSVNIPGIDGAAGAAGAAGPNTVTSATTTDFNGFLKGNGASLSAVSDPLPIANGGTGAASAPGATQALGTTYRLLGVLKNANFNSTADQEIDGFPSKWIPRRITAQNASIWLTTAKGGIYTAAGKTGHIIVAAAQSYTALTASGKFKELTIDATAGGPTTDVITSTSVFFALTTAQGADVTGDIYIWGEDLS